MTLEPDLERILNDSSVEGEISGLEPGLVSRLYDSLTKQAQKQEIAGEPTVLLVAPNLRPWMARMMRGIRNLYVLAYNEIPDNKQIQMIGAVS